MPLLGTLGLSPPHFWTSWVTMTGRSFSRSLKRARDCSNDGGTIYGAESGYNDIGGNMGASCITYYGAMDSGTGIYCTIESGQEAA